MNQSINQSANQSIKIYTTILMQYKDMVSDNGIGIDGWTNESINQSKFILHHWYSIGRLFMVVMEIDE